ncbi:MAG: D-glycerate 3-kinase [Candidatus Kentron sp. G]|nr:MAG: D-glycerate 3-kinase [Candidatus Kentron sp. G]VFN07538.1 MAG: D-glycerate 3-kinase [Candidatus Kentron sp. G]VFN08087.1 MAG: D-glycerate 3-kinase [Candidatus Kentron sp. G]
MVRYGHRTDSNVIGPKVIGINGSQGAGKSTLCRVLEWLLHRQGKRVAIVSIDDLYLSRARRGQLASRIHPLLETRGVPGTHDVALGIHTLRALLNGEAVSLPRFNKAEDDPYPPHEWPVQTEPVDLILFEGWCVDSRPQPETDLHEPINRLEAEEDRDGYWRSYVNRQLAGPYRPLFDLIDCLILFEAADFSWVYGWRKKQEDQLRQLRAGNRIMDDRALERFVQYFERITRHNWATLPEHAHIRLMLDRTQRIVKFEV